MQRSGFIAVNLSDGLPDFEGLAVDVHRTGDRVYLRHGKRVAVLTYVGQRGNYHVFEVSTNAPRAFAALVSKFGSARAFSMVEAARNPQVLSWVENHGYQVIRRANGDPAGFIPRTVIAGQNPLDLGTDGDRREGDYV